jgi:hypothetical protein
MKIEMDSKFLYLIISTDFGHSKQHIFQTDHYLSGILKAYSPKFIYFVPPKGIVGNVPEPSCEILIGRNR